MNEIVINLSNTTNTTNIGKKHQKGKKHKKAKKAKKHRKRHYCEFSGCSCRKFKNNHSLCFNCGHGRIWHSLKGENTTNGVEEPPPCDSYLSFKSSRGMARKPQYLSYNIPIIFIPNAVPISNDFDLEDLPFCEAVELLPV